MANWQVSLYNWSKNFFKCSDIANMHKVNHTNSLCRIEKAKMETVFHLWSISRHNFQILDLHTCWPTEKTICEAAGKRDCEIFFIFQFQSSQKAISAL